MNQAQIIQAMKTAYALLDSVAFVTTPGDTDAAKLELIQAIRDLEYFVMPDGVAA